MCALNAKSHVQTARQRNTLRLPRMLGLDGSPADDTNWVDLSPSARAEKAAFVCLGGGHYAPKPGDLARRSGSYVGHMLASYVLDFGEDGWRSAVSEAVRSTRVAFPGAGGGFKGGVGALVDKKAFRSRDRAALLEHLDTLGVEHRFKSSEC